MAPDSRGAFERSEFGEPTGCTFPYLESSVPSLISDLRCADRLLPLLQTCIQPDFPSRLLGAVFSELLRCCLPGSESSTCPPNKTPLISGGDCIFWSTASTNFNTRLADLLASLIAQLVKNLPAMLRPWFDSWVGKICWRRERLPTPVFLPGECHGQRSLAGCSPWFCKRLTDD